MESDEVCGMSIDHVFACMPCLQDYRSRLELDTDDCPDVDPE
jgi:hypothetical protein